MARPRKGEEKNAPIMFSVRIPEWVQDGLQQVALERSVTVSEIANDALVAYLKRKGIKPPAASAR